MTMANAQTKSSEPVEPIQRRPTDIIWFILLFLSIATGIGMTIFAPI
jgi:hypothetical protein